MAKGFDDLSGIMKGKETQFREEGALVKMIETTEKMLKEDLESFADNDEKCLKRHNDRMTTLMADVDFDERDLESYIRVYMGTIEGYNKKKYFGRISGAFLNLLTERNKAAGKRTRIEIDGNGKRLDYIFFNVSYVDELILRNFTSECPLGSSKEVQGRIGTLALIGMSLRYFYFPEGKNRNIRNLIMVDNEGQFMYDYGSGAKIELFLAKDNKVEVIGILDKQLNPSNATDFGIDNPRFKKSEIGNLILVDNTQEKFILCGLYKREYDVINNIMMNKKGLEKRNVNDIDNYLRRLMKIKERRTDAKEHSEKILELTYAMNRYDTGQMLSQIGSIREECSKIKKVPR